VNKPGLIASYKRGLNKILLYADRVELGNFSLSTYRLHEIRSVEISDWLFSGKMVHLALLNGKKSPVVGLSTADANAFQEKFTYLAELLIDEIKDSAIKAKDRIMDSFDKYSEFTKARNWEAICRMNNVDIDSFVGTGKEQNVLAGYLDEDEVVFALTSGLMTQTDTSNSFDFGLNTWLVALTNERFLFLDCALLTSSVDTQSIRHDKVQAVSASQGWALGKITIDLGSRMIVIDNCQKASVSVIADLANEMA
jgi:hypothetical protein